LKDVAVPRLGHDHVLVALKYAGVGIWDTEQRAGAFGQIAPETILGTDGAGTNAAVGANAGDLAVGDRVYSYSYGNLHGFYAEYVNVAATHVAHLPAQISDAVGGGMPCVALTALSGLEALKLKPKQTLLVYGASGGVGSFGVWLGNIMGATVVASARPDAHAYVRELDAALITAGGSTLPTFLSHMKPQGSVAYPNGVESVPHDSSRPPIARKGRPAHQPLAQTRRADESDGVPARASAAIA
jgi:NADPH:quinone reductase-like Zn-dependent oxidoreductase